MLGCSLMQHSCTKVPGSFSPVAEDDVAVVKDIGRSFRFSAVEVTYLFTNKCDSILIMIRGISITEFKFFRYAHFYLKARREEEVKAAHDQAMFGAAAASPVNLTTETIRSANESEEDTNDTAVGHGGNHLNSTSLISDKAKTLSFLSVISSITIPNCNK